MVIARSELLPTETDGQPLFSILSSVYRTEPYLAATIESVLAQTMADWELIVVDNGMSDAVVQIVERYSAIRVSGSSDRRTARRRDRAPPVP